MQKTRNILFVLLIATGTLFAQQKPTREAIGITFSSLGESSLYTHSDYVGGPSYSSDGFFTIGLTYLRSINRWLDFEMGIGYGHHRILVHPNFYPGINQIPRKASFSTVDIPLTVRANFFRYFFCNGGLLIDLSPMIHEREALPPGFGFMLGVGAKYDFPFGGTLFLNPYIKSHSLITIGKRNHLYGLETGFRIGFTYDLSFKTKK